MKELLIYQDDNGEWLATSEKMPGFVARGKTQKEALDKMKKAFSIYYPCAGDNCKDSRK
ncbi:MAG: type II toxin-antitoxin system HicB family antitoxin [Nitrospirae bacterium]|nr:type II toxin-antitoxin system HicB family antitoxin [Nitrospirota bacterium]